MHTDSLGFLPIAQDAELKNFERALMSMKSDQDQLSEPLKGYQEDGKKFQFRIDTKNETWTIVVTSEESVQAIKVLNEKLKKIHDLHVKQEVQSRKSKEILFKEIESGNVVLKKKDNSGKSYTYISEDLLKKGDFAATKDCKTISRGEYRKITSLSKSLFVTPKEIFDEPSKQVDQKRKKNLDYKKIEKMFREKGPLASPAREEIHPISPPSHPGLHQRERKEASHEMPSKKLSSREAQKKLEKFKLSVERTVARLEQPIPATDKTARAARLQKSILHFHGKPELQLRGNSVVLKQSFEDKNVRKRMTIRFVRPEFTESFKSLKEEEMGLEVKKRAGTITDKQQKRLYELIKTTIDKKLKEEIEKELFIMERKDIETKEKTVAAPEKMKIAMREGLQIVGKGGKKREYKIDEIQTINKNELQTIKSIIDRIVVFKEIPSSTVEKELQHLQEVQGQYYKNPLGKRKISPLTLHQKEISKKETESQSEKTPRMKRVRFEIPTISTKELESKREEKKEAHLEVREKMHEKKTERQREELKSILVKEKKNSNSR